MPRGQRRAPRDRRGLLDNTAVAPDDDMTMRTHEFRDANGNGIDDRDENTPPPVDPNDPTWNPMFNWVGGGTEDDGLSFGDDPTPRPPGDEAPREDVPVGPVRGEDDGTGTGGGGDTGPGDPTQPGAGGVGTPGGPDGSVGEGGDWWNDFIRGEPDLDPFIMDTLVKLRDNPDVEVYMGPDGPVLVTNPATGEGITILNPDGSITPGAVEAVTRQVTDEELVANQMSGLLAGDSKYMQDARRQGLEMSNAVGGLGGTVGIGAAMQSAMRAALPIAQADAQAFRDAASDNMEVLNQFAQLNHQRVTQLELAQIDSSTRLAVTKIGASVSMATAQLTTAAQRDIARLGGEVQLRAQEMQGMIQDRLASLQFQYSAMLNDAQYSAGLQNTFLGGQFDMERMEVEARLQRETTYISTATGIYEGYMNQLASLNGMEMDANAKQAAIDTITQGVNNLYTLLNSLYPDMEPITLEGMGGSGT